MSETALSTETLDLLRKVDTPTVCNALELFDVRPRTSGYMDQRIQACFPEFPPMVGFASTATFRSSTPAQGDAYSSIDAQIESFGQLPGPAVVVFQDLDEPSAAATFGEVMCTTYQSFGAAGLITSGTGRDLEQVRAIGFPAFTNGTICAHGYCHFPTIGDPVQVGGLTIRPGDLLHGDCNGVTTIPLDIACDVAKACARLVEAEQVILEHLKGGETTAAEYRDALAEFKSMISALGDELK
ncbi:MAG: RraA family protein [Verrucomicrobia bacterium]|nr:RraA family protein [Verrucomicrobiota bacterium]MDA1087767.1 RraA family protein [Verrucomicrobiota bacterium]